MKWLSKIEDFINGMLILVFGKVFNVFVKCIPSPVRKLWTKLGAWFKKLIEWCKNFPSHLKNLPVLIKKVLNSEKFKAFITSAKTKIKEARETAKNKKDRKGFLLTYLGIPKKIFVQWMHEFGGAEVLILTFFTLGSILSSYAIYDQTYKLLYPDEGRYPASVEEEDFSYRRPDYYKLEQRELTFHHFYIPIYFPKVNEVRSINVDFSVTTSNRATKHYLARHDFELRNHIIMHLEPIEAKFGLTPEGKEVVKDKILREMNDFLKENNFNGKIIDVKIIYLLSH